MINMLNLINKIIFSLLAMYFINIHEAISQDLLIYTSGEEIEVKVLKINHQTISYLKFSNLKGPEYIEQKSNIFMIKYKNGTKDVFKDFSLNHKEDVQKLNKKSEVLNKDCQHNQDTILFLNNKYMLTCKDCNKKIRYATINEVSSNGNTQSNMSNTPCGQKPIEPPKFSNPQYKKSKEHKAYYKKLKKWKECTGK